MCVYAHLCVYVHIHACTYVCMGTYSCMCECVTSIIPRGLVSSPLPLRPRSPCLLVLCPQVAGSWDAHPLAGPPILPPHYCSSSWRCVCSSQPSSLPLSLVSLPRLPNCLLCVCVLGVSVSIENRLHKAGPVLFQARCLHLLSILNTWINDGLRLNRYLLDWPMV